MEENSDLVKMGKILDEESYSRMERNVQIDDILNVDFIKNGKVLHEVKKSRKIEEAGIWQVKYYLYYLKKKGMDGITGQIDYPLLRQTILVDLTAEDFVTIEKMLDTIGSIIDKPYPPCLPSAKKICKNCAFFDLCYV